MGNENSGEAKTQAPPLSEELESDLAKVEADHQEQEAARAAKLKRKQDAKRAAMMGGGGASQPDLTGNEDDKKMKQAAKQKAQKEKSAAEREQLGLAASFSDDVCPPGMDELEWYRNKARREAQTAKDNTMDSLVTVDRQIEQTRRDNKKLVAIEQSLASAEEAMDELEKSAFLAFSSSASNDLPPLQDGDVVTPFQQWKNVFTRYHEYTFRFCKQIVLRINHHHELKNSVRYSTIKSIHVKKDGFVEIHFDVSVDQEKWTIFTEGENTERIVKEFAQRKQDVGGDLHNYVTFETGCKTFRWEPTKSEEERRMQFIGNGKKAKKKSSDDPYGLNAGDDFLDDIMGDLGDLDAMNRVMANQLNTHQTELEKQEKLVKKTNARLKPTMKRMDQWLDDN